MNQDNGGVIGKINTPTTSVASGVWSIQDQFEAQSSSTWPLAFPQTTIANSCRFDSASNDYLNRALSSGTGTTFTLSAWVKRSDNSKYVVLLSSGANSSNDLDEILIQTDGTFRAFSYTSSYTFHLTSNAVFKDVSAWYNFIFVYDSTNSTSGDRARMYVNGSEITSFSAEVQPSQGTVPNYLNKNREHYISGNLGSTDTGTHYIAEYCFIDGQALTPSSFGAFNPVTNIWEPIAYAGTYGTNGFRLDFADSSALGADVSGNSNNFTVNNLTSVDQSTDTCSNNFATLNPLASVTDAPTFSDGNLTIDIPNNGAFGAQSTIGVSSGKWYAEFKLVATSDNDMAVGVNSDGDTPRSDLGPGFGTHSTGYRETGTLAVNGTDDISYGNSYAVNDIVGIALDLDNNKLYFSKNGVFQNSGDPTSGSTGTGALSLTAASSTQSGAYFFNPGCHSGTQNGDWSANFGSPPYSISSGNADANGHGNFEYAVPSGYFALCTKNLSEFG